MFTNRRRILKHLLEHIWLQYDNHQAKELLAKAGIMHELS
jgi:hypothetical protein